MLYPPGSRRQPPPPEQDDPDLRALAEERVNAKRAAPGPFANAARGGQQNFGDRGPPLANSAVPTPGAPPVSSAPPPPAVNPPAPAVSPQDAARQAAEDAAKQKAHDATAANKAQNGGAYVPGDLSDLARMQLDQQHEYAAREADLKASKAQALQQAEARAGLGGMGLSGGTAALVGDVSRVQDRGVTEDLMDLARSQRGEQFDFVKQQAALDDLETSENRDIDGDGKVAGVKADGITGDGTPDDFGVSAVDRKMAEKAKADSGLAKGGEERGSLAGWHPGTNDFQVDANLAKQAHESPNIPLVGTYLGSDKKWNYFRDVDGSIVKVRR